MSSFILIILSLSALLTQSFFLFFQRNQERGLPLVLQQTLDTSSLRQKFDLLFSHTETCNKIFKNPIENSSIFPASLSALQITELVQTPSKQILQVGQTLDGMEVLGISFHWPNNPLNSEIHELTITLKPKRHQGFLGGENRQLTWQLEIQREDQDPPTTPSGVIIGNKCQLNSSSNSSPSNTAAGCGRYGAKDTTSGLCAYEHLFVGPSLRYGEKSPDDRLLVVADEVRMGSLAGIDLNQIRVFENTDGRSYKIVEMDGDSDIFNSSITAASQIYSAQGPEFMPPWEPRIICHNPADIGNIRSSRYNRNNIPTGSGSGTLKFYSTDFTHPLHNPFQINSAPTVPEDARLYSQYPVTFNIDVEPLPFCLLEFVKKIEVNTYIPAHLVGFAFPEVSPHWGARVNGYLQQVEKMGQSGQATSAWQGEWEGCRPDNPQRSAITSTGRCHYDLP